MTFGSYLGELELQLGNSNFELGLCLYNNRTKPIEIVRVESIERKVQDS